MVGLAVFQRLKSAKNSTSKSPDAHDKPACEAVNAADAEVACEWQKETVKVRKREQNFQAILSSLYIKNHAVLEGMPEGYVPPPPAPQVVPNQFWTIVPSEHDVLCGRGSKVNHHPGNVSFREMVAEWKDLYLDENRRKTEKAHVCAFLVDKVRATTGGRFLKRDDRKRIWVEIGDIKARKKAGQALREDATEIRAEKAALKLGGGSLLDKNKKEGGPVSATSDTIAYPHKKKAGSASTPDGLTNLLRQKDTERPKPPATFYCVEKLKNEEAYPDSVIMKGSVGSFPVSSACGGQSQKTDLFSGTGIFDREIDGLASLFSATSVSQNHSKSLPSEKQSLHANQEAETSSRHLSKTITPELDIHYDLKSLTAILPGQKVDPEPLVSSYYVKEADNQHSDALQTSEAMDIPEFSNFNLQYFDHSDTPQAKRRHVQDLQQGEQNSQKERCALHLHEIERQTSNEDQQLLELRGRRPSTSSRGNESTSTCTNVAESILVESVVSFDASSFHDIDLEHWVDDCYSIQSMKSGELVFLQQPKKKEVKRESALHDEVIQTHNEAYADRYKILDRLVLDNEITFDSKSPSIGKAMSILSASVGGSTANRDSVRDGSQ